MLVRQVQIEQYQLGVQTADRGSRFGCGVRLADAAEAGDFPDEGGVDARDTVVVIDDQSGTMTWPPRRCRLGECRSRKKFCARNVVI